MIPIQCPCGKRLEAPDGLSGREARCPSCQALVRVPGGDDAPAAYGVEQVRKCKGCRREWPLGTVVCVECGYNFETGRRMRTKYRLIDRVVDLGAVWAGTYTRYRISRDGQGKPRLDVSQKVLFLPLGRTSYDLSAYIAVLTDYASGDDEGGDVFYLELEGPGRKNVTIFRSSNEQKMLELVDLVAQAGRLEIKRK